MRGKPTAPRIAALAVFAMLCSTLFTACNMPEGSNPLEMLPQPRVAATLTSQAAMPEIPPAGPPQGAPDEGQNPSPFPDQPETLINFYATLPVDTPEDEPIFLVVVDEVSGLAVNTVRYPMEYTDSTPEGRPVFNATLPFKLNSVLKYRYERMSGAIPVAEHYTDGGMVRYRMLFVESPGSVYDIVSRWTDTEFTGGIGRIRGVATDAAGGAPLPNLLVTAGGAQTITKADGSFVIEGLPVGTHNLVAYAMDGSYRVFQQGARIEDQSTTPADIQLNFQPMVNILFVVSVPADTPPAIPLRLAGNLYQIGQTFGELKGGFNSLATKMPVLNPLPDGRYTVTISLPAGADIRYKYTLGDGFWNAERSQDGQLLVRQFIVPDENALVEDQVLTWHDDGADALIFDVTVPENTPEGDFVSIQFNPLFGWTEPVPMWNLGNNRWVYMLYSPLNLPGNFSYRYCRNNQCGYADDVGTPGLYGEGRPVQVDLGTQTFKDQVSAWIGLGSNESIALPVQPEVVARGPDYQAAVELVPDYHPSWQIRVPDLMDQMESLHANWLVASPTWTYGHTAPGNMPPTMEPIPGLDPQWYDLADLTAQAHGRGLKVAIKPAPNYQIDPAEWWTTASRDYSWWLEWFDQYRTFILHHADLASYTNSEALVLGSDWVTPALPGGTLSDGTPSGVPAEAEKFWRSLISEVRTHYSGTLVWALPAEQMDTEPVFITDVDQISLEWSPTRPESISESGEPVLGPPVYDPAEFTTWLDNRVLPFQILMGKPLALSVAYPTDPSLQSQVDAYNQLLIAASQRAWISGFVSRGYYYPVAMQDPSDSIHGKPASALLSRWFEALLAAGQ